MRRTLAAATVVLSLAIAGTPAIVSAAADVRAMAEQTRPDSATAHERATRALDRAKELLGTPASQRASGASESHRDATVVLRDLFSVLDDLSAAQRREARAILARPTDGPRSDLDGYKVRSVKQCSAKFCVHWVKRTTDAPPSKRWALKMLALMDTVWKKEVGGLGYRRPLSDNGRGGNNKFDVYLAQLGNDGVYGYCAPERTRPGFRRLANGYCVLDNDFSRAEFGTAPIKAAKATAAHEFFHAIQFGYDFREDLWMMESTATWMEERVFDDVNDNRQYLPAGQLVRPLTPLDLSQVQTSSIYANWVFFEFLSTIFGNGVVRNIWKKAGAFAGAPNMYSTQAIRKALASRGGFTKAYSRFAGANVLPAKFYPEGRLWPSADLASTTTLSSAVRETGGNSDLLHMTSQTWRINSSASLAGSRFRLNVQVDGPAMYRMPGAHVLVLKHDGTVQSRIMKLGTRGNGTIQVPFDHDEVASVYVSLANASTRFRCNSRYVFSCNGFPIYDGRSFRGQPYEFSASVVEVT